MNRKEEFLEKNKNIKNINEPKNPYNHIIPNELPNADDYINIINDSESEEESPNKENIKYKQLKNENKEDKTLFESESKIKFTKKDEKKEQTKEKSTDKEIRIFKEEDKKDEGNAEGDVLIKTKVDQKYGIKNVAFIFSCIFINLKY